MKDNTIPTPTRIPESAFGHDGSNAGTVPERGDVPDAIRGEIGRLAREWSGGRER